MTIARRREGNAWVYSDPAVDQAITSVLLTHGLDVSVIDDWIESDDPPWDEASRQAVTIQRHRLVAAKLSGNDEAVAAWAECLRRARYHDKLRPLTLTGRKFTVGRKRGTVGKLRSWIRKWVAKHPSAMPSQAWEALKAKPPKGFEVCASSVWVAGDGETGIARFKNIVSEERRALRDE